MLGVVLVPGDTLTPLGAYPTTSALFPLRRSCPLPLSAFLPQPAPGRVIRCAVGLLLSPRRSAMHIHAAEPLFAWGQLEDCPTLTTIRDFLDTVPDQQLLDGLRAARGHGRDDYPVALLWHVVLLTAALRHTSFNACLAELHRNPALCRLLGITASDQIPHDWNLSRFLDVLGREPHLTTLREVFDELARRLGR